MGAFFCAAKSAGRGLDSILANGRDYFAEAQFSRPTTFDLDDFVIDYYPKLGNEAGNHLRLGGSDFIFSVGTFFYRGHIGIPALKLFAEQPDGLGELHHCRGHFALILRKNGRTLLLRDPAGFQDVFFARDGLCLSSSFLAVARAVEKRTISVQEVYEYVFAGVSLGRRTPISEIERLDAFEHMVLSRTPAVTRQVTDVCPLISNEPVLDQVVRNLRILLEHISELVALFGPNVTLALSGGYDTRLLLALFRQNGVSPRLFVYGNERDPDVKIAKQIASAEQLPLWHLDKASVPAAAPDEFREAVRRKFLSEDGLDPGGIFSGRAEAIARGQRNEGGALHVNGGGGEVFRNFFYLLDRSISPRQFVWCFYSQFDPAQCTTQFNVGSFEDNIANKARAVLDSDSGRLSRREVECLYPYFRCRSWFGRENSVNNRYGYSVLPFLDYRVIRAALEIPITYKHFGNFESAMIRLADSELAQYPSNYGYSFDKKVPYWAAARWLFTYMRPPWLRRNTFRVRAHLQRSPGRDASLTDRYLAEVIDTSFPCMSQYFKPTEVKSAVHFARICTLEYLFAQLSVR